MNLYIKKISTLAGVGVISILSTFQTFTNVDAALTPPASWDYKYTKEPSFYEYKLSDTTGAILTPAYTRTADGVYYNYETTFSVITGLQITQTFNRSNTSWIGGGTSYYPIDTKIGSNNTVGSISSKLLFSFNNQTNNHYRLFIDISSTPIFSNIWSISYPDLFTGSSPVIDTYFTGRFMVLYIPSITRINFTSLNTSNPVYLDAWYLEDLGISASYQEGYLDGETDGYQDGLNNNPNILLNGFSAMVGILVNFMLLIFNLEAFGISILSVFGVLAFFVGVIWFFKLLRG
jgi:hypothetical protein